MAYLIAYSVALAFIIAFVVLSEKFNLLSVDYFATSIHKVAAYAWFSLLILVMTGVVVASSRNPATADQLKDASFWSLFSFHVVLLVFLAGWWLLTGRPRLGAFLNIPRENSGTALLSGLAVGVGGWMITILLALLVASILAAANLISTDIAPSPMMPWLANLEVWKKIIVVVMAMTVEEFFFRAWLQKRIGLIASTIIFAVGHAGYGQPAMLIGVTIISLVIGMTFYRTKDLRPCIIAHGVFDAIQIFVIVPAALKFIA